MEDWEREAFELLSPLRDHVEPQPDFDVLVEKILARVNNSIAVSDLVELGTSVLVCEFLESLLYLVAVALGFPAAEEDADRMCRLRSSCPSGG